MEPTVTSMPKVEEPGEKEVAFQEKGYAILGTHGDGVDTVEGYVFRVRFFINGEVIEEDLPIPVAKSLDQLMEEMAQKRYTELKVK